MKRIVRVAVGLCFVSAATIHSAPVDAAASEVTVTTVQKNVQPNSVATIKAHCPKGTKVTGGGFETTVRPTSSVPFDDADNNTTRDDGWKAVVTNPSSTIAFKVTVHGVCAKGGTYTYLSSAPISVPDGGRTNGDVLCDDGFSVVGGGVALAFAPGLLSIGQSGPIDDDDDGDVRDNGWTGGATNLTGTEVQMTVFGICESTNIYSYFGQNLPAPAFAAQGVRDDCPANSRAVGGGVTVSGTANSFLNQTRPDTAPDQTFGTAWRSDVAMGSTAATKTTTVICRSLS